MRKAELQRISTNRRRGNFDSNSSTICCAVDAAIITQQRARERKRSAGSCAEQFNVATFGGNVALVRGRPRPPGWSSTPTPSTSSSLARALHFAERPKKRPKSHLGSPLARPIEMESGAGQRNKRVAWISSLNSTVFVA